MTQGQSILHYHFSHHEIIALYSVCNSIGTNLKNLNLSGMLVTYFTLVILKVSLQNIQKFSFAKGKCSPMNFCPSIQNLNEYCFADVKVNTIFIVIVLKLFEKLIILCNQSTNSEFTDYKFIKPHTLKKRLSFSDSNIKFISPV